MKSFLTSLTLFLLMLVAQSNLQSQTVNYFYAPDGSCCATVTCDVQDATEFCVLGLYGWQTWNGPVDEITFCQPYTQPGSYTIQFRDADENFITNKFFTFEDCSEHPIVNYYSTPNGTCCAYLTLSAPDAAEFCVIGLYGWQTWNAPVDEIGFCQPYCQPGSYTIQFRDADGNFIKNEFFVLEDCSDHCDCDGLETGLGNIFTYSNYIGNNAISIGWTTDIDHPCWAEIESISLRTCFESLLLAGNPEQVAALNGTGASYLTNMGDYICPIPCPILTFTLEDGTICEYSLCGGILGKESASAIVNKANVYPNPASEKVNIEFNLAEDSYVKVTLYDISGNVVANIDESNFSTGKNLIVFDTDKYVSGSYYITLTLDSETISIPLTIAK